jgi:hypothetical protein
MWEGLETVDTRCSVIILSSDWLPSGTTYHNYRYTLVDGQLASTSQIIDFYFRQHDVKLERECQSVCTLLALPQIY